MKTKSIAIELTNNIFMCNILSSCIIKLRNKPQGIGDNKRNTGSRFLYVIKIKITNFSKFRECKQNLKF